MPRTKKTSVQANESPARYSSAAKPVPPFSLGTQYWIGSDADGYYVTNHRDVKVYRSLAWLKGVFTCAEDFPVAVPAVETPVDEPVTESVQASADEDVTTTVSDYCPDDLE